MTEKEMEEKMQIYRKIEKLKNLFFEETDRKKRKTIRDEIDNLMRIYKVFEQAPEYDIDFEPANPISKQDLLKIKHRRRG
jgi:hypothetical protein